jgi:hypothetical protein
MARLAVLFKDRKHVPVKSRRWSHRLPYGG